MLHDKVILVVGGDLRQAQLAKLLSDRNTVYTMGLEKAEGLDDKEISVSDAQISQVHFDYIVFPMPIGSDGETVNTPFSAKRLRIDDALSFAEAGTYILGGKLSLDFCRRLEERGLGYTDYFLREELSVLNAIPVAVSAVVFRMILTFSQEMSYDNFIIFHKQTGSKKRWKDEIRMYGNKIQATCPFSTVNEKQSPEKFFRGLFISMNDFAWDFSETTPSVPDFPVPEALQCSRSR